MSDTNLTRCQLKHDNAEPDCSERWIDTEDGKNWLDWQAVVLADGGDVEIADKVVAGFYDYCLKLVEVCVDAHDPENHLGQVLANVWAGQGSIAQSCMKTLLAADKIDPLQIAKDLIAPHADAAFEEIKRQNEDDQWY